MLQRQRFLYWGRKYGFVVKAEAYDQETWILFLTPSKSSCVTTRKPPHVSVPQFLQLQNGHSKTYREVQLAGLWNVFQDTGSEGARKCLDMPTYHFDRYKRSSYTERAQEHLT